MDEQSKISKRAKFCRDLCPDCKMARKRGGIFKWFVKNVERKVCPMCRAYERELGRPAYE